MLTSKIVNDLLEVDDSYKAPESLLRKMLDNDARPKLFDKFLEIEQELDRDWFVDYFQEEHSERKRFNQDFTPLPMAELLNKLAGNSRTYFESAAGSGGLLISAWDQNRTEACEYRLNSSSYWYQVEELSDRAVPFLIFNMAIRGMNGAILHGNSLERTFKEVYFIRNESTEFLKYSEVFVMPKTEMLKAEFDIKEFI